MSVLVGGFGIFWTIMAAASGAPFFFPLFGVGFVITAIFNGINSVNQATSYQAAESHYLRRRGTLLSKLRGR